MSAVPVTDRAAMRELVERTLYLSLSPARELVAEVEARLRGSDDDAEAMLAALRDSPLIRPRNNANKGKRGVYKGRRLPAKGTLGHSALKHLRAARGPVTSEQVARALGRDVQRISLALSRLRLAGYVTAEPIPGQAPPKMLWRAAPVLVNDERSP